MNKEIYKGKQAVIAPTESSWRDWLIQNHDKLDGIWLIIFKKESNISSVYYPEAVNQALCFGWIDSLPNKRDEYSYYQYFSKRNPKSNWSRVNKEKVAMLEKVNLIAPKGLEMIALAKKTGTWDALNDVEDLKIPIDLMSQFEQNQKAYENWLKFPASAQRGILEWLFNAKRDETRQKRISELITKAEINQKILF